MKTRCIEKAEGLTVDKEYRVRNAYGVKNGYKLEIKNDFGYYEEYERKYFSKLY